VISFAQNGEDVVLARAFAGVKSGCYIDVGAADPVRHSVTKHFYDLGWTGVNVEPLEYYFGRLQHRRARDINVRAAVTTASGRVTLAVPAGFREGTTLSKQFSADLISEGRSMSTTDVEATTLGAVRKLLPAKRTIDFIKIDVEGHEGEVLASDDLSTRMARVYVIESIRATTRTRTDSVWGDKLRDAGYERTLFDGINTFWCRAEESVDFKEALSYPANYLDDFVPHVYATVEGVAIVGRALTLANAPWALDCVRKVRGWYR